MLEELYVLVLSRPPRAEERKALQPLLEGDDPRGAARELAQALLLSREFGSIR